MTLWNGEWVRFAIDTESFDEVVGIVADLFSGGAVGGGSVMRLGGSDGGVRGICDDACLDAVVR